VSLDWWKIDIEDAISEFSASYILDQCYGKGISAYCDLVTRDATGTITQLLIKPLNVGQQRMEGYDLAAHYRLPETAAG
ncbi:hypothetical protein, partial [Burkholderia sp. SIMBA_024]|uniref:hypothetical protein n=1 Tax=Burkholderia sp. SIMBA_024 TaxID=3085768 RepID=UPI00397917D1